MTAAVGTACLVVGFGAALYAVAMGMAGAVSGRREFVNSARWAVYCLAGLLAVAMLMLESAYLRTDLSFKLVAQNSSEDTPTFYKFTAMWSSQEGSLLLWAWVLSLASAAALYATRNKLRQIVPWATAVMMGVATFFTGLMLFAPGVDPFASLSPAPSSAPATAWWPPWRSRSSSRRARRPAPPRR